MYKEAFSKLAAQQSLIKTYIWIKFNDLGQTAT